MNWDECSGSLRQDAGRSNRWVWPRPDTPFGGIQKKEKESYEMNVILQNVRNAMPSKKPMPKPTCSPKNQKKENEQIHFELLHTIPYCCKWVIFERFIFGNGLSGCLHSMPVKDTICIAICSAALCWISRSIKCCEWYSTMNVHLWFNSKKKNKNKIQYTNIKFKNK